MRTFFTKYKILTGVVILLLILNLTVLTTILINNNRLRNLPDRPVMMMQHMMSFRQGMFLRDELRLNEDQYAKFRSSRDAFQKKAARIENDIQKKKIQLLNEMTKAQPDPDKIEKTGDEIGLLHSKMLEATSVYYDEIRKICNPEQKILLDDFFTRVINGEEYNFTRERRQPLRRFRRNENNNRPMNRN